MSKAVTVSEILENRAAAEGERTAYVFLSYTESGVVEEPLSFTSLDARARAIGASLQAAGAAGERVLLLFPPGPDFVASFFGCLYAGAVAVPALPPRRRGADPRLAAICRDARPRVALASESHLAALESAAAEIPELAAAVRMAPVAEGAADWRRPVVGPDSLAFLQYTSGSTSTPKGVMVSHGNLLHNEELIRQTFEQSSDSVVLGWLPLYHDMGLIGTMLQPLYAGAVGYLMTPGAFLQRPARWLEAISKYRATTSGGPNFAYDLCVRKIGEAEKEGLDLSSWRVAFNGAEPVRAATLRRFAEAFAPCGFDASAFRPCYGLAEATLLVSGWRMEGETRVLALDAAALERHETVPAEGAEGDAARSRELVSCGAAMQTVLVVDAETGQSCASGRVGEIWVASPSVAHGYWQKPEETAATFGAHLADGTGPFLRTGDLGFVSEGEVFLTGRLKDLIILRGRNHYPQDLELTAERSHAALRAGGGAAFAVDVAGEERLVIVHEVDRHARAGIEGGLTDEIAAAVRQAVAEEHEVSVAEVVLIRPETLPRTSSGKVRRRACRDLYLENGLRVIGASRLSEAAADEDPRDEVQVGSAEWLRRTFAAAARIAPSQVDVDLPLSAAGLDSLAAVELKQAVEEATGVPVSLADLLEGMTLRELEERVAGAETAAVLPVIEPAVAGEAAGEHPLSWNQRSLWFLHRLAPESAAYNIAGAARLLGPVSVEALGRALRELADRHPMLRAVFAETPAGPVQRVAAPSPTLPRFAGEGAPAPGVGSGAVGYEIVEAEGWSDAEVRARLEAEAYRPFDLAAGPLLRAVLVRRGEESFLALAVHHVAADFWSMAVLARELGALVAGETLLPPAALYTDFARRQEQMLAGHEGERLWEHWRERLGGVPQLDLPTDRPRRPVQALRGGFRALPASPERAEALRRLAAAQGSTPFVALLAAWQAVLSRWSGQDEFLTGAPMAGRSSREWAEVVGYFVNLVPLAADLSGDLTVGELMARTRRTALDALAHQDFPFALLTERLQPERDLSRPPLVAAMLTFEKSPAPELTALAAFAVGMPGVRLEAGGLTLESLPLESPAAQLDLALTAAELPDGLALSVQWDADLFDAATIDRLTGHLDRLLAGMAAAASADTGRVADLPLLSPAERHQMLAEWNDTAVEGTPEARVHRLFEAQAARTPDAPALAFQGETLTYAELDARADRLARHLRRLGCAAESRVGVALERSTDLVVALLGVLKAGSAYVPLDPDYPRERLAYVLEDAAPRVLITETGLRETLPAAPDGTAVVYLNGLHGESLDGDPVAPESAGDDRQLAYVLYTSGSTGRPKGVGVPHRALVNFLGSMRQAPGFAAGERLLAVTSLSFDIAALEIFLPLTVGGCVELASRAEAADGALLAERLRSSGAAVLQATPATWRMLLDAGWEGDPALRVLCGGEALPRDLAAALAGRVGELWNLYGPTETTIWSSTARVLPGESGPVSIGRPIAATQIHLLDPRLQTVPLGAPGELWIGGAGLARGYLGRPDLTADRFLPNPLAVEPEEAGSRLYRTGDLARHLPGGQMEVLGRLDHQVKVRGFRIELGEIEAVLAALPGVRQAVVVAREFGGDRRLVAYAVAEEGTGVEKTALLQGLRERLPEYMVPAALMVLPAFPLTPNGKVDRKSLPAPEWEGGEETYVAPRTPVEEIVAGIWAEVLGRERVGVNDHFFELGGHSLLATRVMSRLRGALGVEVPLRELFAAPRLEGFAARVEAVRRADAAPAVPPLVPAARGGDLPLSFQQQRLWFVDQLEPGSPLYNMPGALRAEGPLDPGVLALTLGEIVRRHETLRTVFAAPDGVAVQVIQPARPFALPVVDLAGLPEAAREALVLCLLREEADRPFDLANGPIVRGLLLRLGEQDHAVALTLHHIAGDGWSLGVLTREIAAIYPALATGKPSPLADLRLRYVDFAMWQLSWLRGETLEREIDWWRGQLAGLPPVLELPTDRPRPVAQSHRGASRPVRLPAGLVRRAEALGRQEGATLYLVLLAAFQALLARYSGQDDVAVGSPVAGRNQVETEGLIGLFVNTLVLRGDLSSAPGALSGSNEPSFRELLGRTRETALAAWLHQDVPFEKVVDELAPDRSLAHSPLFQAMLVLQNAPAATLELADVRLHPIELPSAAAKFDLTLTLEEQGGDLIGDLAGTIEYATDLFDATTIDRLAGHFERLLAAAVEAPERRVFDLPFAGEAERAQVLREWNDAPADAGTPEEEAGLLHRVVAAQAARTPDAVALETESESWTYRRLVGSARRLARELREQGVGPDSVVGLCAERSPALVVAMLAILEAGGAWLPLDPSLPAERLGFLLDDAGAGVVLAPDSLLGRVPAAGRTVVPLEGPWDAGEDLGEPLAVEVTPGNLAYVIYTSGSTGRPKGVMLTHAGICNRLRWARLAYGVGTGDAFIQKASIGFDVSVWETFGALTAGARLFLAAPGRQAEGAYLVETVRERRITFVDFVPSMLAAFLAEKDVEECVSLRYVLSGGEALGVELRDRALALLPGAGLDNTYGPTEVTIDATRWVCAPGQDPNRVPIGRPVAGSRLYVVDAELRPLPAGAAGELVVGGPGVARGYLGRPFLTAERFVPDPFAEEAGERLYRTGDLVRQRADGALDFLGRLDHQVKLRGFRIELGEIEAALFAVPGVRDAAVLARESRLVAYLAVEDLEAGALRGALLERLPEYMVPAVFVTLPALPLMPSGKVNRRALAALPAPDAAGAREEGYVAPRTREEEILAAVWAQVLRLPRVGVEDNFFELGGDSILSVQIVARARQAGLGFAVRHIFEHQTVAGLARHVTVSEEPSAPSRPAEDVYPLTPLQNGMLFHSLTAPESGVYVNQVTCTLPADLDAGLFRASWERLIQRHTVLRTAFLWEGLDEPRQEVRKSCQAPWQEIDWSALPEEEGRRRFEALRQSELAEPLPLDRAPLMRFALARLGGPAAATGFVWTFHHLLLDGWSVPLLVRELVEVYAALREGREPALTPAQPFGEYVAWLRRQDEAGGAAQAEAFWRAELAGFTAANPMGIVGVPRPGAEGAAGYGEHHLDPPREAAAALRALAARHQVTLQTVTQAAWAVLVGRYSDSADVVFGGVVSGRPAELPGVESMVGLFINTLPVRARVDGAATLGAWLPRLQERQLARQEHEHTPLAQIQRWSEVAPGSPLFETLYVFENYPDAGRLDDGGLRIGDLRNFESTNYPLTLTLTMAEGLSLHLISDRARVADDAAARLLRHFATLLAGLAEAKAEERISELPLLGAAERQQLLEWGGIRAEVPPAPPALATLHGRFAAQARQTPEAPAVTCGDVTLTYGELLRRADRLAGWLRRQGAGPESRIGLSLERSVDQIVGLLGVLTAGAAYVPLDPDAPRDRRDFIAADAGIEIVVTADEIAASAALPAEDLAPLAAAGEAASLAYVIYTSGSTGRPKGTLITHANVTRLFDATAPSFGFGERDVWTLFHSYTFDFSVWEIWGALLYGGRLVVVPWEVSRSPEQFLDLLARERVTVLNQTPSAFTQLIHVDELDGAALPDLRLVVFGGEALDPAGLRPWFERHGDARPLLVNMYGITETTVHVTGRPLSAADAWGEQRSAIGAPISDLSLAVMDRELRPVPPGVPGELVVGGAGLARGYLGRPELTAERFVPDPSGTAPGARLYRSGDLGRFLPDGDVEYLGRLDHQVKIRGFRIELGEIEAALTAQPGVRQAVVLVREDQPGDRRLVAYVAGDADTTELRLALRERLPDYMVPAAFVTLAALPLTVNGKVDRKALAALGAVERPAAGAGYVAPRTRAEQILAGVWAQVLRLPRVGVEDNFFELGGDSILSVQIVARARKAGLSFGVRQIFEHPTVAGLAEHATTVETDGGIRAEQGAVSGAVPLTPIQRWFFAEGFAEPHHYNQGLVLEAREALAPAALERALAAVLEHHDALRMRFDLQGEEPRQENAPAEPVTPFHRIDLAALPVPRRAEAYDQAAAALQAGFDLSAGPLTRLALIEADAGQPSRLLWLVHHLVVDGVSWRVLVEDLEGAYRQAERGERPAFPPKTTSFQEWARRLADYAGSEKLARELAYWRETAEIPAARLPLDFPGGANLVGDQAEVTFELSAEETAGLLQAVPAAFHSRVDDALLSALVRALAGWTGADRLRVDLEGHGREPVFADVEDVDLSRTVGWFTSLYPVVLEAGEGDAGPADALVRVKERLRAVPGRGIGHGLLRHLNPEAASVLPATPAAPSADILFNYLGQADSTHAESPLFRASTTGAGPFVSPQSHRTHALEVSGIVTGGRLAVTLSYGSRLHRRETVERLAAAYAETLRELIARSRASAEVFTPSDFPRAALDPAAFRQVAALLADPAEAVAGGLGSPLRNVADLYPLTPLQGGMLFHSLMEPESGVYVNQVTCTLPADLDAGLFRQAWQRLLDRHTVLRTAFLWEGLDTPLQAVRRSCEASWRELDWSALSEDERQSRFEALRHEERHAPFALDRAPLTRFALVRLGDGERGFVWTFHHLLLDGWSLPILVQELVAVYEALREGRPGGGTLPPARPFGDYVAWLQKQDPAKAEPFWRAELAGFGAPNALGILGAAPAGAAAAYEGHRAELPRELAAGLQALAARHQLTLQTLTQAAWALLLSRYGAGADVVFGSVVSGRPAALPGVETMVGMFVNTLPVRARVDEAASLADWLRRLQERQLARQEFEHTPLAQIQRWSEVPAGSPLFEALYVFENYPDAGEAREGGLRLRDLRSYESTNYPVTLALTVGERVALDLSVDRTRVDGDAAPRLLQHFATLLAGLADGAEKRVGDLDLLTAAERAQILGEWNDTRSGWTGEMGDVCLHHPVGAQAARTPSAIAIERGAVELGDERWTYRRLVGSARLLARHLRELGVGPDTIVGLCAERSPEMVVGMLAILKAGGAYLPLDPTLPADRLSFMLDDSRARVLLLQPHLRGRFPAGPGCHVVPLDARWSIGEDEDMEEPLGVEVTPDSLAYVIYTSGSTGRPKGVMVPHRGVANRLRWAQETYRLGAGDAVLQKASFGFDFSAWECFAPLWAGARLVLAEPGRQGDGEYLVRTIRDRRVTFVHFVPSMLAAFLTEEGVEGCTSLRQVFSGGEALTPELRDRALSRLPAPLDNQYGPTEISIDTTRWTCAPGQEPDRVPIGRPIANSRLYVVDPGLRPAPAGVAGELLVGGAGVTRGYLRRPDLTAERFVPDPFGGEPGGRLYRTGDLARWLSDGTVDFLGRVDHQVKVRGFRIELGEIEAALVALPAVHQAAVIVRDDRLVAYVVGRTGDPAAEELRKSLRERLPEYMVPAVFVTLPALPLNASGKVDRKALPAPEQPGARDERYVGPRNRTEEILAGVWAQVLRLPRVGVESNFFELGGDSILSVQIVARARQAGLSFSVREIFEHPTVAGLARHAQVIEAGAAQTAQGPVTGEVPLTPIQRWFFDETFEDPQHFNQALVLEAKEALAPVVLEGALAAILAHHDALRMRFDYDGEGWRQENAPAEPATPFHHVDLSALPAARREEACEEAAAALQASLDLSAGPLTRLALLEMGADRPSKLLWLIHHLVVDGVSWRVLLEDLEAACRALARGERPPLPPKTTSFQEWARRLAAHAGSEELARELEHWRETARAVAPRLPVDLYGGANLEGDAESVSFELTAGETADLLQTVPSVYHSRIDDALLSALVRALSGWTGSSRLRVDLEGHGREPVFAGVDDVDTSRTVGWFTTMYPVVLEAGGADPGEALVSVKERLRAVPGRGIGYGLLRHLRSDEAARALAAAPPAEVLFNYLGQADGGSGEGALFRASTEGTGPVRSRRAHRTHALEVTGIVTEGRLQVTLAYGSRMHRRETVERLAASYADALRQLIQHSQDSDEVFTPSDFTKVRLDARSFGKLAALLDDDSED